MQTSPSAVPWSFTKLALASLFPCLALIYFGVPDLWAIGVVGLIAEVFVLAKFFDSRKTKPAASP